MSIAKFVFGLVMVVGFGHQALACGGSALDCRIGNDKVGGKFCVYEVGSCNNVSCEKAVKCTVEKWSGFVTTRQPVSSVEVSFSKAHDDGTQLHYVETTSKSGKGEAIVITKTNDNGQCEVLAIE